MRKLTLLLFIALTSCAAGNTGRGVEEEGGISRIRYLELRIEAEKQLFCDKDSIQYRYLGEKVHLLRGCGREIRYLVFNLDGIWVKIESFHKRAAFELQCPAGELGTSHLGEGRWRVSGCGETVEYILHCDDQYTECEWYRLSS